MQLKCDFEKELQDTASMMGWDEGTQNILKLANKDGRDVSLIAEYSQIDTVTIKAACKHSSQESNKWRKTTSKCGAVCTIASLRMPRQHCLPIERTVNSSKKRTQGCCSSYLQNYNEAGYSGGKAMFTALQANLSLIQYAIKVTGNIDNIHTSFYHNYVKLKAMWSICEPCSHNIIRGLHSRCPICQLQDDRMEKEGDMRVAMRTS